jgi:hypothetical protein
MNSEMAEYVATVRHMIVDPTPARPGGGDGAGSNGWGRC